MSIVEKSRFEIAPRRVSTALGLLALVPAILSARPSRGVDQILNVPPPKLDTNATAEALSRTFSAIAERVGPAVVRVFSERIVRLPRWELPFEEGRFWNLFGGGDLGTLSEFGREFRLPYRGPGSGMLIDHEGRILTTHHLVHERGVIKVQFANQNIHDAAVVGADAKSDVAVLQIQGRLAAGQSVVELGDSSTLNVGDVVLAIGAPAQASSAVTHGIVSARGRVHVGATTQDDLIQTDVPFHAAYAGGPLLNTSGKVIGMQWGQPGVVTPAVTGALAIPINTIKAMLPTLSKGERIVRGQIGVTVRTVTETLARSLKLGHRRGILITHVSPDSPAQKAGLKIGDVIAKCDGKPVLDAGAFEGAVSATKPGRSIELEIIRDLKTQSLPVIVGPGAENFSHPDAEASNDVVRWLGLAVDDLKSEAGQRFRLKEREGALITNVETHGPAALAGLRAGDLILEANQNKICRISDLHRTLAHALHDTILLVVEREGTRLLIVLEPS